MNKHTHVTVAFYLSIRDTKIGQIQSGTKNIPKSMSIILTSLIYLYCLTQPN